MAFLDPWMEALREAILGAQNLTQNFGPSSLALEPAYQGYAHFHEGVDLVLPGGVNAVVRAPASGRVIYAGGDPNSGYGTHVIIQAPNGWRYLLGHLHDLYNSTANRTGYQDYSSQLHVGDLVTFGQPVGHQGTTGASTGVHLHLGLMDPNGIWQNPGNDVRTVFYNLYHSLGGGGAANPGQFQTPPPPTGTAPSPVSTVASVPSNEEMAPVAQTAGSTQCPPGTVWDATTGSCQVQLGLSPTMNPGNSGPNSLDPGNLLAGLVAMLPSLGPALALLGIGAILIIGGVSSLSKEEPVQIVTQPLAAAAGEVKTVGKAAAAAAA